MRVVWTVFAAAVAAHIIDEAPECDVLIAGGSTASLAAALTAANSSASLKVCFLEITDWPGGQMTSSAVPAIDFGPKNSNPPSPNLPRFFNELLAAQPGRSDCWVSAKCYQPQLLVKWMWPVLSAFPNLIVYLNTTVVAAERDGSTGRVTSVTAVQRMPQPGIDPWAGAVSAQIADWYDPANSTLFSKRVLRFTGFGVVVDGTEFGDVLATAGLGTAQGVETPQEDSTTYLDYCGQGTVFPLFITLADVQQPPPQPVPVPPGSSEGAPFSLGNFTWERVWSYRRTVSAGNSTFDSVASGETSNQNWGGGEWRYIVAVGAGELVIDAGVRAPGVHLFVSRAIGAASVMKGCFRAAGYALCLCAPDRLRVLPPTRLRRVSFLLLRHVQATTSTPGTCSPRGVRIHQVFLGLAA